MQALLSIIELNVLPRYGHHFMSVSRECPYLGRLCPYLGDAWVSYKAKLTMNNIFFPSNIFGSATTFDKVIFRHHLAYLIAISYYSFKYQTSVYMETHSLDTDTCS